MFSFMSLSIIYIITVSSPTLHATRTFTCCGVDDGPLITIISAATK